MNDFLLSQIIASIAFACGVISFQCKQRRTILLWMCGSALTNAGHFFVLERFGAGTLYTIMAVRVFTAAFSTDRRLLYVFLVLILIGFSASYERPIDIMPMFGASLATYGNFQQSVRQVRLIYMACAALWMVHNTLAGSPVAVLMETTFLMSNIIGYWRFHRIALK